MDNKETVGLPIKKYNCALDKDIDNKYRQQNGGYQREKRAGGW